MMGFRARSVWLGGVILLVVMLVSLPGLAETETEAAAEGEVVSIESAGLLPIPDYSGDIWTRSHLTGDWGEVRSHLASKGVQAEIRWNQTVQSVVDGGRNEDTDYGGSLNYDLTLDLMRMGVLPGALIRFRAESRYGDSINSATGSILPANLDGLFPLTSPIDDDFLPITVTSLNYTQFLSEHIGVTVGKFDTLDGDPNEFAGGRGVSQFLNSNFIFNPSLALIVPYSTLGFGIIILPNDHLTVTSLMINTSDASESTGFGDIGDGATWSTEAQLQYRLGNLPGGANLGFAYAFDNDFTQLNGRFSFVPGEGISTSNQDDTWAVYGSLWQYLYTESETEGLIHLGNGEPDHQGIGIFARIGIADNDTNPAGFSTSFGLGGRGIIPSRDDDTFGLGYFYIRIQRGRIGGILGIDNLSQGFEAFYNIAITAAAHLTVDIQILDSAAPRPDTATVLGMRFNLRF